MIDEEKLKSFIDNIGTVALHNLPAESYYYYRGALNAVLDFIEENKE